MICCNLPLLKKKILEKAQARGWSQLPFLPIHRSLRTGQSVSFFSGSQIYSQNPWFHVSQVCFLHTQSSKLCLQSSPTFINDHPRPSESLLLQRKKDTQPLDICKRPPVDTSAEPGESRRDGKLVSCLLNSKENRHFPQMCKARNGILFMCQHPVRLLIVRLKTHMGYPPILLWRSGKENRWDVGEEKGRDPDRHWKGPAASLEDKALRWEWGV